MRSKTLTSKNVTKIAIFSALAVVLYFIKFPLPFFPAFLEINLSDLPALIGGFAIGPFGGFLIVLIKILIKLPFTSTLCAGELADLIIGGGFVVSASIIYKKHKNKKGALISMLIGSVVSVILSVLSNWLFIIPFYVYVMNWDFNTIVKMCSVVLPNITQSNFYLYYLPCAVLPFNALRCFIVTVITYFVYKRISNLLRKI